MTASLQGALYKLKLHVVEMGNLVYTQLEKARQAFLEEDEVLAHEVVNFERHVDSMDLRTDAECEEILALYSPVASDLRFVLASLRINLFLERIGDHACSIAEYTFQLEEKIPTQLLEQLEVDRAFSLALQMLKIALRAYEEEKDQDIRRIFRDDHLLNSIARAAPSRLEKILSAGSCPREYLHPGLYVFSVLRKLERVGDLCKNIGEEVVFYLRARSIKHIRTQTAT